ncbi:MAG: hypothetical protein AAGA46_00220 [Cyanobacteria bacterium P01_F01_bin.13]
MRAWLDEFRSTESRGVVRQFIHRGFLVVYRLNDLRGSSDAYVSEKASELLDTIPRHLKKAADQHSRDLKDGWLIEGHGDTVEWDLNVALSNHDSESQRKKWDAKFISAYPEMARYAVVDKATALGPFLSGCTFSSRTNPSSLSFNA